jgi:glycine/D-amino acid oxidase-like deaminating enzyme
MAYVTQWLEDAGVFFEKKHVSLVERQLQQTSRGGGRKYDIVVNCTGLGAFDTENDTSLFPIRGQVLRVHAPWIKTSCTFDSSYVIPNVNSLVIGGTGQKGDWNTDPSEEDSQKILDGVCGMFPSLRLAKVLGTYVGLRPCRPSVRLDSELVDVPFRPCECVSGGGLGGGSNHRGSSSSWW